VLSAQISPRQDCSYRGEYYCEDDEKGEVKRKSLDINSLDGEHVDRRSLSRTVRSQEAEHLASLNAEVYVIHCHRGAVEYLSQSLGLQDLVHHRNLCVPCEPGRYSRAVRSAEELWEELTEVRVLSLSLI